MTTVIGFVLIPKPQNYKLTIGYKSLLTIYYVYMFQNTHVSTVYAYVFMLTYATYISIPINTIINKYPTNNRFYGTFVN